MRSIAAIFKTDIKGIVRNFFVLVVVLGVCALPALYAWFNIYANWDPYANTKNVKLAAAIEDAGWTDDEGSYWNLGEELKEELAASTAITWVFVDSDEEAQEGVRSGTYYAAIALDENFSESVFSGIGEKNGLPQLKYYLNDKRNAVATKVTDTAVEGVQNTLYEKYIYITTNRLFGDLKDSIPVSETRTEVETFISDLKLVNENLVSYSDMIDTFMESNNKLGQVLDTTSKKLDESVGFFGDASAELSSAVQNTENTRASFNAFSQNIAGVLSSIQGNLDSLSSQISSAQLQSDAERAKAYIQEMLPVLTELNNKITVLLNAVMSLDPEKIPWDNAAEELQSLQNVINTLQTNATKTAAVTAAEELADSVNSTLRSMSGSVASASSMLSNEIIPSMNDLIVSMEEAMGAMSEVMTDLGSAAGSLSSTLLTMGDTIDILNAGMPDLQDILEKTGAKITELEEKISDTAYSEQLQSILDFLSGDTAAIGNYFAEPVKIEDHYVYEIENYGSGVAPFYTALAIWVGMTILVSVLKVHPKQSLFPEAKRSELFLGKYLLFLLLSEIQTAIIVIGELYVFKIQCLYPGRFFLAAAVASLTISLIVYSLTVSFGDIGKAIALISLIIQIAGSGGTYPIEILPSFFKNIYQLFPFPHIINAMRECIGGMYGNTYVKCLLILGIFSGAALVLGLLLRLPLIPLNKYAEERMEDTKLM